MGCYSHHPVLEMDALGIELLVMAAAGAIDVIDANDAIDFSERAALYKCTCDTYHFFKH
jgi:hypothetical protein